MIYEGQEFLPEAEVMQSEAGILPEFGLLHMLPMTVPLLSSHEMDQHVGQSSSFVDHGGAAEGGPVVAPGAFQK
jgi:hypothetical protein